ncbi:CsiV family protein [Pseudoalteromonas sp. YIC-827]|uniref:CsiV family protein n=1 Tax=Pseudoalteromonas qingdaonensis TaxID=3131913 RepID=A0ABU9MWU0_9GAMM
MIRKMLVILAAMLSAPSYADGRWFEIEVLVFEQGQTGSTETLRNEELDLSQYQYDIDLLTPAYLQTLNDQCTKGELNPPERTTDVFADTVQTQGNYCDYQGDDLVNLQRLPKYPIAEAQNHTASPYVLAPEQLQFNEQRQSLSLKGKQVLLHTGWRFAGQSKRAAPRFRLFGGEQVATMSKLAEQQLEESLLLSPSPHYEPQWQLDGFLKVHLNHYLYITSNLVTRAIGDTDTSVSGEFSQFRRVISGEIHYFDHPQIGMLVQIRRFNH